MITLSATNMSLEVLLGGAVTTSQWEVVAAFVDITTTTYAPTGSSAVTNNTTAVTVVAAPAASTQRQIKYLSIYNADTVSGTVTVRINTGGTMRRTRVATLATGETLCWDGVCWRTYTTAGAEKLDAGLGGSAGSILVPTSQRTFMSILPTVAGSILTSGTAYWVYMGLTASAVTVKFVEFVVSTAGAGAQTAEVAIASSPSAPNKSNQSLTKLAATGTVDSLITTGVKRNTSSLATVVNAGTHLWAGLRVALATTQPQILGLAGDFAEGQYLLTAASGALTGAGPFTGAIVAADTTYTWRTPDLRVVLD